jgi:hypothetical protein
MEHVGQAFQVNSLEDWYRISLDQLRKVGVMHILPRFGGLQAVLERLYPDHKWEKRRFSTATKRSSQRLLYNMVCKLFPHDGSGIKFPSKSKRCLV